MGKLLNKKEVVSHVKLGKKNKSRKFQCPNIYMLVTVTKLE